MFHSAVLNCRSSVHHVRFTVNFPLEFLNVLLKRLHFPLAMLILLAGYPNEYKSLVEYICEGVPYLFRYLKYSNLYLEGRKVVIFFISSVQTLWVKRKFA